MQCSLNNTKMSQFCLHTSQLMSINVILQNISIHVLNDKTQLQDVLESKMYFYFLLSLINNL